MEGKAPTNEFLANLSALIETTERTIKNSTHNYIPLLEDAVNYVEAALYSNLIRLYAHNLNEEFFQRVKMGKDDRAAFTDLMEPYFSRAKQTSESTFNEGEVDFRFYQEFREAVHGFGDDTYWLLLGVEKYADIIACEHRLIVFKNSMRGLKGDKGSPKKNRKGRSLVP